MASTWKEQLQGLIREDWSADIDQFEAQIALRKQGKIDEKVFAETRLRRGTYGQRYDKRPPARRHRPADPALFGRDEGAGHILGCAGDDSHQDPLWGAQPRADPRLGGTGRGNTPMASAT